MIKPVFWTNFFEQKRTIESLLKESRADGSFYLLLSASTFITALGFMLDSTLILVGGMLVAPLLFPILSLGMGITTSSQSAITRAFGVIAQSVATVFMLSLITSFLLNRNGITDLMLFASRVDLLFFLTAFISGVVAAYAWVKENLSSTLPGIAVTVSLIPPLVLTGMAVSLLSKDIFTGALTLFLLNFLGIVLGSTIIFSLFGFSGLQEIQERKIKEEKREKEAEKITRKLEKTDESNEL